MKFLKIKNLKESKNLYLMNNHKDARKYSFNKQKFSFIEHQKWLKKKIKSEKENLYIFKSDGETIGYIREQEKYKKKYLSWSILPKKKFRGYGSKMLNKFLKKKNKIYYAFVHKKNLPSKKMSLNLGFKIIERRKNFYFLRYSKS